MVNQATGVRGAVRMRGAVMAGVVMLAAALISAEAQFTPYRGDPKTILEGTWESCRAADGQFAERVYDHVVDGVPQFEVHLGPHREFAIFKGVQDEHRAHASEANLLKPFDVAMVNNRARQRWEIPSLNLVFTVTMGGGSRTDCENWYILLEPLKKTS
jgi:hypothetical protein